MEPTNPQSWKRLPPNEKEILRAWRDAEFFQDKLMMYGAIDSEEAREICRIAQYDLSEALQRLGRTEEAMAVAVDDAQHARCQALHDAIHCDDSDVCDCPNPTVEVVTAYAATGEAHMKTPVIASRFSVDREILSLRHGKIMKVRRCNHCGDLNVTDRLGDDIHLKQERGAPVRTLIDAQIFTKEDRRDHGR